MKRLLQIVVIVLVVAIGALVAFLAFFDPNAHRDFIAGQVRKATGRELALNGPIELHYYPWLSLKVEDLALGNAPGFGDQPMLAAKLVQVRVKLVPLLRKRIEMDTVRLHGLRVNLARKADGTTNWADLAAGGPAEAGHEREPLELAALAIGGVDVADGAVVWDDAASGRRLAVRSLGARTGPLVEGQPVDLTLDFDLEARKPELAGHVSLAGKATYSPGGERVQVQPLTVEASVSGPNVPGGKAKLALASNIDLDLDAGVANLRELSIEALDATVRGNVTAKQIRSGQPTVDAVLDVQGQDLARFAQLLDMRPLLQRLHRLPDRSYTLALTASTDTDTDTLAISRLAVHALGATIESPGITVERVSSGSPAATGRLAARGPDLPALVGVAAALAPEGPLARLDKALAGAPKAFSVDSEFAVDLDSGAARLPTLAVQALGTTVRAKLDASGVTGDAPSASGELDVAAKDLPLLLRVAGATAEAQPSPLTDLGTKLARVSDRRLSLGSRFAVDLGKGSVSLPGLDARALGLTLNGEVSGTGLTGNRAKLDGTLRLAGKDLREPLTALGQKALAGRLRGLEAEAVLAGRGSRYEVKPLKLTASLAGGAKPAALAIETQAAFDREQQTLSVPSLAIRGLGLDASANVEAKGVIDAPSFEGAMRVPAFDLRALLTALGQPVPKTADPKVLTRVGLDTGFSGTAKSLKLPKLAIVLDDTSIRGDIDVRSIEGPDVAFGVGIDHINVDRYLPPKRKGPPPSPEAAAAGAATLPVETLKALKVDGNLVIGELVVSGARLQDVKLSVKAADGLIRLDPVAAKLYEGGYQGQVTLDARTAPPKLAIASELAGVQVGPLMKDVTGKRIVTGTGNIKAVLNAVGASDAEIRRTLGGQVLVAFRDGTWYGVNIGAILRQADAILSGKPAGSQPKVQATDFSELTGTFNVRNGVVTNDDLSMKSPAIRVSGKGMVANLATEQVDYTVSAALAKTTEGQGGKELALVGGYQIPVRVRGTFSRLRYEPDFGGLAKAAVQKKVQEQIDKSVGDKLKKAVPGEVGKALEKLFKF